MSDYKSGNDRYGSGRQAHSNPNRIGAGLAAASLTSSTSKEARGGTLALPPEGPTEREDSAFVRLPHDEAQQLIASGQADQADDQTPTHELVSEHDEDDGMEHDEADWALDEAIAETEDAEPETNNANIQSPKPSAALGKSAARKLPFPIVLPQRRPGTKTRGFEFHKSAQASPIFDVIIIATAIAGAYPDPIIGLGVQAVQIAAAIGQEIQERLRTNNSLTRANKDIYIPKGMYAMIVAYKKSGSEQSKISTERVDLGATAIAKYDNELFQPDVNESEPGEVENPTKVDERKEKMKKLHIASGKTHGEAEMPITCAPLIFPALDNAAENAISEAKGGNDQGIGRSIKTTSKNAQKFVNNYFDRRAQATCAYHNPDSTLTAKAAPAIPFQSRYADPNNHTNMHLFTLLTGGKFKAEPLGARRRWERAQRKAAEQRAQGIRETSSKRLLQENVLYLMIVKMPTEAELEKARIELQEAKEKKAASKISYTG